jgi:GDP/UDP-N,N'-diacetylbacillosamine 2-epimerase (hydrolysing)
MQGILDSERLDLQLLVTGAHLSPAFGNTYREIEADGFRIDRKVDLNLGVDSELSTARAMALALSGCAEAFDEMRPDVLLVLGDRYEIFSAAAAAMVSRIPIAHLHGGETTEGAIDEAIRHSITKMAHLHFVAAPEYERRVLQLGEDPERVYTVGGLGIDSILRLPLLTMDDLSSSMEFQFLSRNLLVTFHPVTLEHATAAHQLSELLQTLAALKDTGLIFTMPNADAGGLAMTEQIRQFVVSHSNARLYASLGQQRYFSCLKQVDGAIGNSSSGLLEVPSFGIGTVNIGDRQRGRLMAPSVINCEPTQVAIKDAINTLYSDGFRRQLGNVRNPYGDGGASEKIVSVLESRSLANILNKSFHDLSCQSR